jgi:hypothetical protein
MSAMADGEVLPSFVHPTVASKAVHFPTAKFESPRKSDASASAAGSKAVDDNDVHRYGRCVKTEKFEEKSEAKCGEEDGTGGSKEASVGQTVTSTASTEDMSSQNPSQPVGHEPVGHDPVGHLDTVSGVSGVGEARSVSVDTVSGGRSPRDDECLSTLGQVGSRLVSTDTLMDATGMNLGSLAHIVTQHE